MINDQNEYFFFHLQFEKGIHYFIKNIYFIYYLIYIIDHYPGACSVW